MLGQQDSEMKAKEKAEESIKDSRENTWPNHSHIIKPNISPTTCHNPRSSHPVHHFRLIPNLSTSTMSSLTSGTSEENSA